MKDNKTAEEILKRNITGYRGNIKKSDAIKSMQEYAHQQTEGLTKELEDHLADLEKSIKPNPRNTDLQHGENNAYLNAFDSLSDILTKYNTNR